MEELNEFYKAYGESLATRLRDINHKKSNRAFVFVEEQGNPVEVIAALTNGKVGEATPFLVWENFEEDIDTAGRDNYHSKIVGSVAILRKGKDRAAVQQAYTTGRTIALKVLALMLQDAESGELANQGIQLEVRQFPCEKIGPVSTTAYGYGFQFTWLVPIDLTLDEADLL